MLCEYEVREQVATIENSDGQPMQKARNLMRICRELKRQLHRLRQGETILEGDHDAEGAARLQRLSRNLQRLMEDVRLAALRCLRDKPARMGFVLAAPPTEPVFAGMNLS